MAVATMLRNVVAAAAGEDPWSGPGTKESDMRHEADFPSKFLAASTAGDERPLFMSCWSGTSCIKAAIYRVTVSSTPDQASKHYCTEVEYPGGV